jgi:hypothetical protein
MKTGIPNHKIRYFRCYRYGYYYQRWLYEDLFPGLYYWFKLEDTGAWLSCEVPYELYLEDISDNEKEMFMLKI